MRSGMVTVPARTDLRTATRKLLKEAETGSSELESAWKSDDQRIEFEN